MRKHSKIYLLLTLISTLSVMSCSDYFSPAIDTLLPEEESYKDFLSSRAAVNGLYADLQGLMTAYIVTGELRGDMLQPTDKADADLTNIYQLKISPENQYLAYRKAFGLIASCNGVIHQLSELRIKGTTYDNELDNMYAESMLIRTWVYFYLYRSYGEVPYITDPYLQNEAGTPYAEWVEQHTDVMLTMTNLIDDVSLTLDLFDPTKNTASEFFNISSAYAILGEIYLWGDQYFDAIAALSQSIKTGNGSRFILDKDLENAKWVNIFKGDESATDEIMTKVIFDKGEKQENGLLALFSSTSPEGNQLIPVTFITNALKGSYRYNGTFKNIDEVGKYTRTEDDPYTSDMPVLLYRAADIHLMLAEAYNRIGNYNVALDLLNTGSDSLFTAGSKGIRGRVALSSLKLESQAPEDILLELEELILDERGRELAFEGKRWFDILRIGKRRNDPDFISDKIIKRFDNPDSLFVKNYFADSRNWYLPAE